MINEADIVVIGSGGLGAATAYYLAKRKAARVVVLDKHPIGSQTSPRAAGMVSCLRKSEAMIALIKDACRKIETFTADTGEPLDWVHSGSLKVARRSEDRDVLEADLERGKRMGLDVEQVSPDQANRLNPFLQPVGVDSVLRIGDDRYFDPAQVATGFARAARARGATLLPNTNALQVCMDHGKVSGVLTDAGSIRAAVVVDAAGAWTRQVAEASGIHVPLVPTRQQLIVTEPIEGCHPELPMVRIMDAAVYARPCLGGLLWGVYEETPRFFDMQSLGAGFDMKDLPLDRNVLETAARDVQAQLPVLRMAKVREFRGGLPTMTADGQHIVGPAAEMEGFFFASGCNVAGLSISPAIGEALAAWILDGEPTMDLSPMTIDRFRAVQLSEHELRHRAAWQYRHFYGAV